MKLGMQYLLGLMILLFFLLSCQQGEQGNEQETENLKIDSLASNTPSSELPYTLQFNDQTDKFELIEHPSSPPMREEEVVNALNATYPDILVEIEKQHQDTLFVRIADAHYLTQSIGTTGATSYLIEATYGFTAIAGIRVVNFSFEEGDHAVAGPYTRESFEDFYR